MNRSNECADARAILTELRAARDVMLLESGTRNTDYGPLLDALAWAQMLSGNATAAQQTLEDALAAREQLYPESHLEVTLALDRLASVAAHRGDSQRADDLIRRMLRIRVNKLGPTHLATLAIMHRLAACCLDWGRTAEAEHILRKVVSAREEELGQYNLVTASSMVLLGQACRDVGRTEEAEKLLSKAYEVQENLLDPNSADLRETGERLAALREDRPFVKPPVSDADFPIPWMKDNRFVVAARSRPQEDWIVDSAMVEAPPVALDLHQYTDLNALEGAFETAEANTMQSMADRAWELLESEASRREPDGGAAVEPTAPPVAVANAEKATTTKSRKRNAS